MIDLVNSINRNNSDFIGTGQRSTKTAEKPFAINDPDKKCPYSCLAKDGVIEYNGVTFACDYKHNCIKVSRRKHSGCFCQIIQIVDIYF